MSKVVRAVARLTFVVLMWVLLQPSAQAHELPESNVRSGDKTELCVSRYQARTGHWSLDGLSTVVQAVQALWQVGLPQFLFEPEIVYELQRTKPVKNTHTGTR